MVIFNLHAIVVAVICLIVVSPILSIISFSPGGSGNETLLVVFAYGLATLVAGVCEKLGLKGRLFFVPMWLLGSVLTFATACNQYGWTGLGVMAALAVCLFGMLIYVGYCWEKKQWAQAKNELAKCRRIQDPSKKEFWEHFQKAYFVPAFKNCSPSICYHNRKSLELLKHVGVDWSVLDPLMNAYASNTNDDSDVEIEGQHTAEVQKLIAEQLEQFQEGNDEKT